MAIKVCNITISELVETLIVVFILFRVVNIKSLIFFIISSNHFLVLLFTILIFVDTRDIDCKPLLINFVYGAQELILLRVC